MDVQKAAELTLKKHKGDARRSSTGDDTAHARWMLQGISEGYIQHDKAHRWLGYAQAILVLEDCGTRGEMKATNQAA